MSEVKKKIYFRITWNKKKPGSCKGLLYDYGILKPFSNKSTFGRCRVDHHALTLKNLTMDVTGQVYFVSRSFQFYNLSVVLPSSI